MSPRASGSSFSPRFSRKEMVETWVNHRTGIINSIQPQDDFFLSGWSGGREHNYKSFADCIVTARSLNRYVSLKHNNFKHCLSFVYDLIFLYFAWEYFGTDFQNENHLELICWCVYSLLCTKKKNIYIYVTVVIKRRARRCVVSEHHSLIKETTLNRTKLNKTNCEAIWLVQNKEY